MAERRMFTKKITESDAFLEMPLSTQCLYFHLNMAADDEGFVNAPKRIQKMVGASEDDLKLLMAKSFILMFESGVIVIKHWKMHNYLRCDRFKPTDYQEEKALLTEKENKSYTLGIPNDNQRYTGGTQAVDVGKDRIEEDRIVEDRDELSGSYSEIIDYLNQKTGAHYKASGDKTRRLIKARMNEGFTVDDFKTVIDKKSAEWLSDSKMQQYLRPETLFGTKFEGYLNQKEVKAQQKKPGFNDMQKSSYDFNELEKLLEG